MNNKILLWTIVSILLVYPVSANLIFGSNLSLVKPVSPDNVSSDSHFGTSYSYRAFDSNTASSWLSNTTTVDHYLQIDLGREFNLTRIWIQAQPAAATHCLGNFSILYSSDNITFTDFIGKINQTEAFPTLCNKAQPGMGSNINYYNFTNFTVRARYVRLNITNARSDDANDEALVTEVGITAKIANDLFIEVRNEENYEYINDSTITFTSGSTQFSNTSNGTIVYYDLDTLEWTINVEADNYNQRSYFVTVGNGTSQTLLAFLINSSQASTTVFNVEDEETGDVITNITAIMYRIINDSWQPVEYRISDITGSVQFSYVPLTYYRFLFTAEGYNDNLFYLNPILYDTYTVKMRKNVTVPYEHDFDDLAIYYYPTSFINLVDNDFTFIIAAPEGNLVSYGLNMTYPQGASTIETSTITDNSAIGGELNQSMFINATTVFQDVTLNFFYETTQGGRRNFTLTFPISYVGGTQFNNTFISNRDNTYGLGIFERMLVVTLAIIFVVGIATMIGQPIPGMGLAVFVWGYTVYIGFVPIWTILPSVFMGFMFLIWKSGGQ